MSKFRYKAFISYSHSDEASAVWLHRAIEAYRIPRNLVGSTTSMGEVPSRIKPVFRDRDELSSASDLGDTVKQALSGSENMIVICSPSAAGSLWVREEIREFVRMGRRDRIFCVIVDGDASASGSIAAVFPDAIAEAGMQEPLAADVRKWADGKQLAKLKVISGMLGVPLDQLRRRELQRRRKTMALSLAAVVAVVAIIMVAITSKMSAEQRRDSGELLVGYKLNELRTLLSQAGEPEKLERLQEWDQGELAALINAAGPETPEQLNMANQLRDDGIGLWSSGDMNGALEKFRTSWALFAEVYRRDRNDQAVFFELGQAEYWIGQVHLDQGEIELAEASFLSYAEITRRLIQMQPKNADWVLEMAYALTNLGTVEKAREGIDPERILQYMQSALEYNQIALVLDPDSEYYHSELGQSHANLADAQRSVCDLDGALQSRQQGLTLETEIFEADSENPLKQKNLAFAMTGYARVQALRGHNDEARGYLQQSLELIRASARPDQVIKTSRMLTLRWNLIIWLDATSGRIDQAWDESEQQAGNWQILLETGLDNINTLLDYTEYLHNRAWLAHERGDTELAVNSIQQGMVLITAEAAKRPNNRFIGNALTLAAYRYWRVAGELPAAETLSLLPDYRASESRTRACMDADMAIRKDVMMGHAERAQDLVAYLLNKGYRESGFMQVCRLYYGCSGKTDAN